MRNNLFSLLTQTYPVHGKSYYMEKTKLTFYKTIKVF